MPQTKIPCVLMRGGTSKGPYFIASDLPADPALRDRVLLSVMGSPDLRQIDGLGGATSLTSKVAIVSRSARPGADVDYLFAQVLIEEAKVDTSPNCGNMLAGVGPFAVEAGLVPANDPETVVRVFNVNTGALIEAIVQTPGGEVSYEGDTYIDGVPRPAAPIPLTMRNVIGSKTGALLPTGEPADDVLGIEVSCVDVAMPMVIADARSFGKSGYEPAAVLDGDYDFLDHIEAVRLAAAQKMGLGDARGKVIPKFAIVAPPREGGSITSRYFVPTRCHTSYAVTGGACLSAACIIPGTVANRVAVVPATSPAPVTIEHPSGQQRMQVEYSGLSFAPAITAVAVIRTARRLFQGHVLVPQSVWAGGERPPCAQESRRNAAIFSLNFMGLSRLLRWPAGSSSA